MNQHIFDAKVAKVSPTKEITQESSQHIAFAIPLSKNPSSKTDSTSKLCYSIEIGIDRQEQATCPICLGDYLPEELKCSLNCKHAFCSACLAEYLNTKINNNEVLDILCPQSGCQEAFTKKSVKKIMTSKGYKKYRDLVKKKMMFRDRKNYCPRPGCLRPVKLAERQGFTVCECGAKICNACMKLDHEGKTCIEAIDSDFEKFAKENRVKFCMMCKTMVTKEIEIGCNEMKCVVCDYQWCWVGGRNYGNVHPCPGRWDPIPPASIRKDTFMWGLRKSWKEGSVLKRIGICLVSPLLLFGFLIFCPTIFCLEKEVRFDKGKPIQSVCILLGEIFLGVLYLPITILALTFMVVGLALFAVLLLPVIYLLRFLIRKLSKKPPQLQTRWRSRNSENFTYRPTTSFFLRRSFRMPIALKFSYIKNKYYEY